jgi:hypothetical protein
MNKYTDKAEKTRDSSPEEPEECINMQEQAEYVPFSVRMSLQTEEERQANMDAFFASRPQEGIND